MTNKVSICDKDNSCLLRVVINESVTIKESVETPGKRDHDGSGLVRSKFETNTLDADGEVRLVGGTCSSF